MKLVFQLVQDIIFNFKLAFLLCCFIINSCQLIDSSDYKPAQTGLTPLALLLILNNSNHKTTTGSSSSSSGGGCLADFTGATCKAKFLWYCTTNPNVCFSSSSECELSCK